MPTISKAIADQSCRNFAMETLDIANNANFTRTSNQSYKTIAVDSNGIERLVEVRFIVAAINEELTAAQMLQKDVDEYNEKREKATKRLEERRLKAEKDKAKREKAKEDSNND